MDYIRLIIRYAASIFNFLIFVRVIMSFIPNSAHNSIGRFVYQATEPILGPIRRILPKTGMIDFSPLIAFLILNFIISNF